MAETEIPPKSALELQIEMEAKELKDVPKIPIGHFTSGRAVRCYLCGGVFKEQELLEFDTHIPGGVPRKACPNCHPDRGQNG